MRRSIVLSICLIVGAIAASLFWTDLRDSILNGNATAAPEAQRASPAVAIEVVPAREMTRTTDIAAIGSLQSDESVQLAPEVAGKVSEIRFDEGTLVKAGDVLVKLDDSLARATEAELKVRLDLANINLERAKRMAGNGTGTTRDLDAATAEQNTARALLEVQRVELAKHEILAPFDGVVGLRTVSVGSYVSIGTELVNLEKIDVLKLDFKVPEIHLRKLKIGQTVEVTVDAAPGETFTGTIYAIDPKVDVNGRALSVRARLDNADMNLRPGLFARIVIKGMDERKVVLVPEAAIVARGQDRLVWLVEDGKAVETKVALGERGGGEVQLEGVASGATVVTAGHARLRQGAEVDIVPQPES